MSLLLSHNLSIIDYNPIASEIASERPSALMQPNMSLSATRNCRNFRAYTTGFIPLFKPYNNMKTLYEWNNWVSYWAGFHDITMHRIIKGVKHTSKSTTMMSRFLITFISLRHWPVLGRLSVDCEECWKLATWGKHASVIIKTDKNPFWTEIKPSKWKQRWVIGNNTK